MLTIEEYRQKFLNELQLAEDWIKGVCEGYEEVIICSDHYPFGVDCPICIWIAQNSENKTYKIYDADWDLFDIEFLPEQHVVSTIFAKKGDTFFIRSLKNGYVLGTSEVEPFGFIKEVFDDKSCVDEGDSVRELLDNAFSYIESEYHYEKYLEECNEDGFDREANSPSYNTTETSRVTIESDYCGGLYLNLYLVARR